MKKSVFTFTILLLMLGFLYSCSDDKKEENNSGKTEIKKDEEIPEKDVVLTDEEACLDIVNSYKQAVLSSIELVKQVTGTEKKSLEDNLEILQKTLVLQQEISKLGQKNVGEQCWKDFLKLQLQFVEALLKVQDKLADGDVLSAFLSSMKDIKDAKETIDEIKTLITE